MLEIHAIVKGKVQGIGFRAKTKFFAEALGLTGYVRNLSDGSVEICAQGTPEKIDVLLHQIKGQFSHHIQHIDIQKKKPTTLFGEFRVTLV